MLTFYRLWRDISRRDFRMQLFYLWTDRAGNFDIHVLFDRSSICTRQIWYFLTFWHFSRSIFHLLQFSTYRTGIFNEPVCFWCRIDVHRSNLLFWHSRPIITSLFPTFSRFLTYRAEIFNEPVCFWYRIDMHRSNLLFWHSRPILTSLFPIFAVFNLSRWNFQWTFVLLV